MTVFPSRPYPSKKAIKEAIAAGRTVYFEDPSLFNPQPFSSDNVPAGRGIPFVGPSAYSRKYYGTISVGKDGKVKVS